ncbi:MAG: Hsp20/alpha crystallin family protein [Candidatus Muiribacteriota bacterium]
MKFERWDPTKEFFDLTNFVRDIFNETVAAPVKREWKKTRNFPVDIFETNNEIYLEAELPGMNKEDIEITLENGYLTISASNEPVENKTETKENNDNNEKNTNAEIDRERNYFFRERKWGTFSRTFEIGEGIDQEDIKADFSNGVLTLRFRRPEIKKTEVKKINID